VSHPGAANADRRVAREFHEATLHTPHSVRTSAHTLDWDVKPFEFKVYPDLEPLPLPRDIASLPIDALAALMSAPASPAPVSLAALTAILYYSAGVTKKRTYPGGGEVHFRAAASTGALYQTEAYVVAGPVDGLDPGLYHFCPGDFTLRRLRTGDVRRVVAEAAADESLARRAVTIVLTALFWRNTWKYRARGYRHLFWDSGTMLANLCAVGGALGAAPRVVTGFVDADVNRLLGLDVEREAVLELVALGPEGTPASPATPAAIDHRVVPLSSAEVDYPELREIHRASGLDSPAAVAEWRQVTAPPRRHPLAALAALPAPRSEAGRGLGETIQRRGSTREFGHEPLSDLELATALWCATRPVPADVPWRLVDLYLIVNAARGISPGAYAYWPDEHALEPIRPGQFRDRSAYLCLEQPLGGDAAAVIYFLAPLQAIFIAYGNRGYRLANLEAGLAGGRAYLAAYAQGFGASGLTFYDREVVRFFSPAAAGLDAIFVTALGRSRTRVRSEDAVIPVTSRLRR
jgi:SagB-type dehydrogenase family enzyme